MQQSLNTSATLMESLK